MNVSKLRVLAVDDESDLCAISKEMLESFYDMDVTVAYSVKEAFDLLQTGRFDAIISDYQMPGASGIDFVRELRASGDRTPFILFTGRGREEVVISAVDNGADGYVQKGTDIKAAFTDLAHKIRSAVIRVRAELALEESEARYRSMIDGSPTGMFLTDNEGNCIYSNPKWQSMTVLDRKGVLGKRWMDGIHDDDRAGFEKRWDEAIESSSKVTYEFRYKNGKVYTWLWGHLAPIIDATGQTTGFLSTNIDITGRRRAEKALLEKDRVMSKASSMVKIGYWVWSNDGDLVYSDGLYSILGIPLGAEVPHDHLFNIVHPDDQPNFIYSMDIAMKKGESELEHRMVRSDGSIITVRDIMDVTATGTGRPVFMLGMVKDITEELTMDQKVREKEDLYRIAFDTVAEALVVRDAHGKLILCNAQAAKQFDVASPEELMVRGIDETHLILQDGSPMKHEELPTSITLRTGAPIHDEIRGIKKKDGSIMWVKANSAPFFKDGEVKAAVVCLADVSKIMETEARMREREAHYRFIADNMTDYITVLDKNLRVTYISPSTQELLGLPRGESYDLTIDDLLPPDAIKEVMRRIREKAEMDARGDGGPDVPQYLELEMTTRNGSRIWIGSVVKLIRDESNEWAGFIVTSRDVTEMHHANEALQWSDKHFSMVQSMTKVGSWDYDIATDTATWSPEAFRIFGRDPALGAPNMEELYSYIDPRDLPHYVEVVESSVNTGLPYDVRLNINLKDGTKKVVRLISDVRLENGVPVDVWGALQDVTEQVTSERVLEDANRKIGLLTSITRHDIKNQMQVMFSWLELMKLNDPRDRALRDKVFRSLESMRALIDFTAEYESLGTKAPRFIDLEKELGKMMIDASPDSLEITNDVKGIEILADPLLAKVLYNLVENVVRHGQKATRVRFHTEMDGDTLRFICEDDGVGVEDERKESIFDHTSFKGHGYGLFFIRTMLAMTGLSIWEEGRPGEGARFVISVPKERWRTTGDTNVQ